MRVVFELDRRAVEFAAALHIDQLRRGDQDVGDGGILQQRLERSKAENFVQDLLDDPVLFHQAERCAFFGDESCDGGTHFGLKAVRRQRGHCLEIDSVEQFFMNREFELEVFDLCVLCLAGGRRPAGLRRAGQEEELQLASYVLYCGQPAKQGHPNTANFFFFFTG